MTDILDLHGIVLKTADHSEYDKRLVILTMERGKITAFARGVKRPGNRLMASSEPFCFGTFKVTEGKSAYNLRDAVIFKYFEEIRQDLSAFYLGTYFLEFADYYSRENLEDKALISLLYSSLLALIRDGFSNDLVRTVFELKIISIEGELPYPEEKAYLPGTLHALKHIISAPPERLFTFNVSADILKELKSLSAGYIKRSIHREFNSLKIFDPEISP